MLIEEAKWFGDQIDAMDPDDVFPMLNIGSSTERFRKVDQPWIDEYIFKPAREKGEQVIHMDMKAARGVDVIGDLNNPDFLQELAVMKFKSVFCSNLFEHLTNRKEIAKIMTSLIPDGGYVFISCPYKYPYHADPIDTGFRPEIEELAGLFPETEIYSAEKVTCGNYKEYITSSPKKLAKTVIRLMVPFHKPAVWYSHVRHLPWMFKNFQASCIVSRKKQT